MCDIELFLPSVEIQKKVVNIYNSIMNNVDSYNYVLDDLKNICLSYIENLRKTQISVKIGEYIEQVKEKNTNGNIKNALGIIKNGFISPKQDVGNIKNYYIFKKNYFVYSPPRVNIGSIGLYKEENEAICSPIYVVFKVKKEKELLPDYLMLWFERSEFLRSTDFYSISSVRNNFTYDSMCEVKIPIPDMEVQKAIANIYNVYNERKKICNNLESVISNLCSILIKGSTEKIK